MSERKESQILERFDATEASNVILDKNMKQHFK
jgi:hypothetical protein